MFTRTIEMNLKPETKPAFFTRFKAEVLPILKKSQGFFDIVVIENETEPNKILSICFWETKKNAEDYEKERYPKVKAIAETFFATPPGVKYYKLEESFSEKLFTTKSEPTRDRIKKSRLWTLILTAVVTAVVGAVVGAVFRDPPLGGASPICDKLTLRNFLTNIRNTRTKGITRALELYTRVTPLAGLANKMSNLKAHPLEKITWVTRDFSEEKKSVKAKITFDSGTNYEPTYLLIKKGLLPCCYATKIREVQP
jgi:heme-degrading monooxygenase HmoA